MPGDASTISSANVSHTTDEQNRTHGAMSHVLHEASSCTSDRFERPVPEYVLARRCPGTWWAPPPSKRLGRAILVRRVRFPSTSAERPGVMWINRPSWSQNGHEWTGWRRSISDAQDSHAGM